MAKRDRLSYVVALDAYNPTQAGRPVCITNSGESLSCLGFIPASKLGNTKTGTAADLAAIRAKFPRMTAQTQHWRSFAADFALWCKTHPSKTHFA